MIKNNIEIKGYINFDPIHYLCRNKDGKESLLAYIDLFVDQENEKYMNVPVYIRKPEIIDYIRLNEWINGQLVTLKGRLECEVSSIKKYFGFQRQCYVVVDLDSHSIETNEPNLFETKQRRIS